MKRYLAAGVLAIASMACADDEPQLFKDNVTSAGAGGETTTTTGPGGNSAAGVNESGSRIRARYVNGEDGSRSFLGWYDSERDEDCSWQRLSSGYRCLPVASDSGYYSDDQCTTGAALSLDGCDTPASITIRAKGACGLTAEVRLVGPIVPTAYLLSGGNCVVSTPPGYVVRTLTQVVPLTEFAAGEASVE